MMRLVLHTNVSGKGPPLTLLHGFTTHGHAWDEVRSQLDQKFRVLTIDLPGHGKSPAPPASYDLAACADDVVATMRQCGHAPGALIGYSMGGRIALAAAIRSPQSIDRLVLESSSPGIAEQAARASRWAADATLADEIESTPLSTFIDHWASLPLFRTQQRLDQGVRQRSRALRLENDSAALAASLRRLGPGSQPSYWDELPRLSLPVLLITGELDKKFDQIAASMHESLPDNTRYVVADAGHTTHLERSREFVAAVTAFLAGSTHSDAANPPGAP